MLGGCGLWAATSTTHKPRQVCELHGKKYKAGSSRSIHLLLGNPSAHARQRPTGTQRWRARCPNYSTSTCPHTLRTCTLYCQYKSCGSTAVNTRDTRAPRHTCPRPTAAECTVQSPVSPHAVADPDAPRSRPSDCTLQSLCTHHRSVSRCSAPLTQYVYGTALPTMVGWVESTVQVSASLAPPQLAGPHVL